MERAIFVFGSNLAGRHGKGAALTARMEHGAIYGQGIGLQGNSYAIPTKDHSLQTLPLLNIREHISDFLDFAEMHWNLTFNVTAVGCGLAGYTPQQIAPFFVGHSSNVYLPQSFKEVNGEN